MDIRFCHSHSSECLARLCHRSVRTPYGPSSCKLVWAWSRALHSAERGVPQVTSFSIQVSLHDDSACLCVANSAHNEGTIGESTMPRPQSNCNEPCMEVLTDQQPVDSSLRCQRGSQGGESWFRWPPAKRFFVLQTTSNNSLIKTVNLGRAP